MTQDTDCISWGENILRSRGLGDWTIEWTPKQYTEGLVMCDGKRILIYWPEGNPNYPLMLHEIAHAILGRGGHDSQFAHQYMHLVRDYFEPNK